MSQRDIMIQLSILTQINDITQLVDKQLYAKRRTMIDRLYSTYIGKGGQPIGDDGQ